MTGLGVNKMSGNGNTAPLVRISAGHQVSAGIWENEITVNGTTKTVLKTTVSRRYKDNKTGEWRSSFSFSRQDIPLVIFCLSKAFEKMLGEENGDSASGSVEEEAVA
jgi:hypothetical protein